MRKGRLLIPMVLGTVLLTGCTETAATIDASIQNHSQKTQKTVDLKKVHPTKGTVTNSQGGKSNTQKKETTQKQQPEQAKSPQQTFQAIEPPKEAKPLQSYYSDQELKSMPTQEAHGDSPTRTVPFGQTLLSGKTDQTNGPLKGHRLVAFYGTPLSKRMGILGESSPEQMMKQLIQQTKAYTEIDPTHPAIPTIELIATSAQRHPGPDGLYVQKLSQDEIEKYVKLAKDNHALLLLDVQLGQASVMHGVEAVAPYLKLPFVELAIDTEYHVGKGETPGIDLGHVDGADIQKAIDYVNDLVVKNHLPDKVVVVHQFAGKIISNKNLIHPTDHVEVALNFDGFGSAAVKMAAYGKLVRKEPIQYGGFKLFYHADKPLLTPKQVLELDPAPAVVDYE